MSVAIQAEKEELRAPPPPRNTGGGLPRWLRHCLRTSLHWIMDAAAAASAYRLAYETRFHFGPWVARFPFLGEDPGWSFYSRMLFAVVPLWLAVLHYVARLYPRPWLGTFDRILRIMKGTVLAALATLAATYIYSRLEYSRMMMLLAAPYAMILIGLSHFLVLRIDAWLSRFERTFPLILLGGGKAAQLVRENLLSRHPGLEIVERSEPPAATQITALAERTGASGVVMVRAHQSHADILELAEACESAGLDFTMIPDLLELRLGEVQLDDSLGLPAYKLQHTSLTRTNFMAKRAFDVLFSLAVLTALSVPLALIALLIRLDSRGPILYRQKRLGMKGRTFEAFKFRTMVSDAEKSLASVRGLNAQAGGFFKAKNDPRITRVGRWLRRFSFDEFPQFLNVLTGDMSVVGPRPLAVTTGEMEELIAAFGPTAKKRMNILPGITGLWQVSGRSDISADQRFALDMFYIERWSLGMDLEIILRTIPAMILAKGAY
ncbi:MAG: sugar transferase [Elusimicrobiota bacterium]|jgi:exopolysaccharide biosynthesis polyprenyl glycosylphosphotransferase